MHPATAHYARPLCHAVPLCHAMSAAMLHPGYSLPASQKICPISAAVPQVEAVTLAVNYRSAPPIVALGSG